MVLVDTDVMSAVVLPGAVTGRPTRLGGEWIERLTGRSVAIAVQTRVELLIWPLVAWWGPERSVRDSRDAPAGAFRRRPTVIPGLYSWL